VGGVPSRFGESGFYRASRTQVNQKLLLDLFPSPNAGYWKEWPGWRRGISPPSITLDWEGDDETVRYRVYHSIVDTPDHEDARRVAIHTINDFIEVTNETGNGGEIEVGGADGSATGSGVYTLTVNKTGDTVTVQATNQQTGAEESEKESFGEPIRFGVGLYVTVSEDWSIDGDTEFTVKAGPQRSFTLAPTGSDTHWFKVTAERNDSAPEVPSSWKEVTASIPPSPISGFGVAFVSASEVEITFTLPDEPDIAGARVWQSWPQYEGYEIPWPVPIAEVSGTAGQTKTVSLSGLIAGQYSVLVRAFDEDGIDDFSDTVYRFYLGATSVSHEILVRPRSFRVSPAGLGAIQFEARTNEAEDYVAIYSDDGTGTLDLDSIWLLLGPSDIVETESQPKNRVYRKTVQYIPSGTYQFLARARKSGTEEENNDVTAGVTIYGSALTIPHNLEATIH
jgi:hypothetical protein